jgi:hypothetical protein
VAVSGAQKLVPEHACQPVGQQVLLPTQAVVPAQYEPSGVS